MNLQQFVPSTLDQIAGNYQIKDLYQAIVKTKLVYGGDRLPDAALGNYTLTGKSRTGKTSGAKFIVNGILCDNVDPVTLNPCRQCEGCRASILTDQNVGLFGNQNVEKKRFEYVPIDCSRVKGKEDLENKLYYDILYRERPRIYFLDEVHLLKTFDRDSMLLRALDDCQAIWLLATALPDQMHPALRGRTVEVETEPPGPDELARWVLARASEAGVQICADDAIELADRYFDCPGKILNQLKLRQIQQAVS